MKINYFCSKLFAPKIMDAIQKSLSIFVRMSLFSGLTNKPQINTDQKLIIMDTYKYQTITKQIIESYYEVYNELGTGFLESVYENAMLLVMQEKLKVKSQAPLEVYFREKVVGEFVADLIVNDKIIVELKAVSNLLPEHKAQLINYLKATDIEIGLLMNFGDNPEFKRYIFDK